MKSLILISIFLISTLTGVFSKSGDSIHVVSHNKIYITTDPSKGSNFYPAWTLFPGKETSYRKVVLFITFQCPENLMCAEWDYLDHVNLKRAGSINAALLNYELARVITAYGRRFTSDWKFTWWTDVTDFSMLLHDSVEIEYVHTGYEPANDRGWVITLNFLIIEGTPPMEPISIKPVYNGNFRYGDKSDNIENHFKPFTFITENEVKIVRFRISQTGHGMDTNGCAEFCPKYREIWFDGKMTDKKYLWKECASNPLYPQAGTWIFDRSNWCPGDVVPPDIYNFYVSGGTQHSIDINMEPYVTQNPSAIWSINAYLIEYREPKFKNDVEIVDIITPSEVDIYSRMNPIYNNPLVIIRNNGNEILKNMRIRYSQDDGYSVSPLHVYNWYGLLRPLSSDTINLPGYFYYTNRQEFKITLSLPNGVKDEYEYDNFKVSKTLPIPIMPQDFEIFIKTNNEPFHNSYILKDSEGKIIYERKSEMLDSNTIYRDTFSLRPGYFEFVLTDTAGDGMEFWYNTEGGKGNARFLDMNGYLLKNINPDFGNFARFCFKVGEGTPIIDNNPIVDVYPIRNQGKFFLDVFFNEVQNELKVQFFAPDSQLVEDKMYYNVKEEIINFDFSDKPDAIYGIKITTGDYTIYRRVKIAK
jgi:hypothetical protein